MSDNRGLASVVIDGSIRLALIEGGIAHLAPVGETLKGHLAGDLAALAARLCALPGVPVQGLTFAPLIPDPAHVLCIGLNYRDHAAEVAGDTGVPLPTTPVVFSRFASSLAAHGQPIPKPRNVQVMDYEAELAVIIGKPGRFIDPADALEHVAGFTIFNDISMRDWQMKTTQWMPGKNFPDSGPLGPVLAPRDAILPGLAERRIRLTLDGRVMQDSTLGQFIFDLPTVIAHVSQFVALQTGDVIATGTPGGVGFSRKPPVLLEPGSSVSVEIEGIGTLNNPITA